MKRRIFLIVSLLIISAIFVWIYDKNNITRLSANFDTSNKNIPTKLSFEVKKASIYTLKIDFTNSNDENKKELFFAPLTFSMKLVKDKTQILIDEVYTINGISGENKDKSVFREINTMLYDPGSYMIEVISLNDSEKLNKFKPKITILRANSK